MLFPNTCYHKWLLLFPIKTDFSKSSCYLFSELLQLGVTPNKIIIMIMIINRIITGRCLGGDAGFVVTWRAQAGSADAPERPKKTLENRPLQKHIFFGHFFPFGEKNQKSAKNEGHFGSLLGSFFELFQGFIFSSIFSQFSTKK